MNTNALHRKLLSIGGTYICALAATTLFTRPALASDHEVIVKIPVGTRDINLSQLAGVRVLYGRLSHAARIVCSNGNRVGLEPVTDFTSCFEKSLGDAVRSVNRRQLTELYLQTHTLQEAAVLGIDTGQRSLSYVAR
jgi:UrcA family protein